MASTGESSSNSASSSGGANTAAPAPAQEDHDHIWNKEIKTAFELKPRSEFLDPCQEAAQRSIRCLNRNDGDRTFCQDYFQAYRDCKKHWVRSTGSSLIYTTDISPLLISSEYICYRIW
ncbi:hypothetical protein QBC37DRAFT_180600 [Rhypophila decipiens]|uniref:Uncharacterized protein n=1 Tax=Rhypophila decipiens TaxID=261697 RepID=A0AAN6Y5S3_9PEZI|nr:hypothetical protein QBC37DRAFT_180600 [Rhypophila decipiens]